MARGQSARLYIEREVLANCDRRTCGCLFIDIYAPFRSGMDMMKQVPLAGTAFRVIMGNKARLNIADSRKL
jgi:FixJ family two-component response regulator